MTAVGGGPPPTKYDQAFFSALRTMLRECLFTKNAGLKKHHIDRCPLSMDASSTLPLCFPHTHSLTHSLTRTTPGTMLQYQSAQAQAHRLCSAPTLRVYAWYKEKMHVSEPSGNASKDSKGPTLVSSRSAIPGPRPSTAPVRAKNGPQMRFMSSALGGGEDDARPTTAWGDMTGHASERIPPRPSSACPTLPLSSPSKAAPDVGALI
jgi:hypothetical protein